MSGLSRPSGGGGGPPTPPSNVVTRTYVPGVLVNDAVYQTGAGLTVDRADATSILTTPVFGIVTALDNPVVGACQVQFDGDVGGFVGLSIGEVYMLSRDPGKLVLESNTGHPDYPDVPGNVIQAVGVATSATTLTIAIQDQAEL